MLEIFTFFQVIGSFVVGNPFIDIGGPMTNFLPDILFKLLARKIRKVRLDIIISGTVDHYAVNRIFCRTFDKNGAFVILHLGERRIDKHRSLALYLRRRDDALAGNIIH